MKVKQQVWIIWQTLATELIVMTMIQEFYMYPFWTGTIDRKKQPSLFPVALPGNFQC